MKKIIKKINILYLIPVLLVIGLVIVFVIINSKKLATDDKLVLNLYNYLGSNDLNICGGLAIYSNELVDETKLDVSQKICNAYYQLDLDESYIIKIDKSKKNNTCSVGENIVFATDDVENETCNVTKVESKLINDKYKEIYGKDIENLEQFQYDATTVCYYENDYYYCGLSDGYTLTFGNEPQTYRTIKEAIKSGDELYIYDYFLKIVNDECFYNFTDNQKNEDCTNNLISDKDIDFDFMKKYGTLYKHTFKENNGSYYWISSTPV